MTPPTCSAQKTGGQQEERHGVVHHVQEEHQQTKCKGPILKMVFVTCNLDDVLLEHGGLPHVLPLPVHLKFVWLEVEGTV